MADISQQGNGTGDACGLSGYCKIVTFVGILAWILLFASGVVVGSQPYLDSINTGFHGMSALGIFLCLLAAFLVYTPTNIALLSMLAGLLGALGRRATLTILEENDSDYPEDKINPLISGILRGFVTYLLIIAGLIVVSTASPIYPPTQEQYLRLAGFCSVLSFVAGYNPKTFGLLLSMISQTIRKPESGPQAKGSVKPGKPK